jgi:3-hydroxybutyryl-CoA dehydrogenase
MIAVGRLEELMASSISEEGFATVAVVGAGFMGSGIAEAAARAGLDVHVYEPERAPLERSLRRVDKSVARAVRDGKLSEDEGGALVERINWTSSLDELAPAEVVIEAASEDVEVKRRIFAELDEALPDAEIVASNTSSIPIGQLSERTTRPERVLGLHFFSPVPKMKLVEIVVGLVTSRECVARAKVFARQLGKTPIMTKDRSGFVVNKLLVPYLMAAVTMYDEGFATRDDIDTGMKLGCGHPMGPLTLCDFIGIDVLYAIGNSLYEEFKQAEYAPPPLLARMVAAGRLGRKSGRGFYEYKDAA